jgi:hypothetical protein
LPAKGATVILPNQCCAGVKQHENCAKSGLQSDYALRRVRPAQATPGRSRDQRLKSATMAE